MPATIATYRQIANDLPGALERVARDPQVARETAYFRDNFDETHPLDGLFADDRLLSYVLKAYGLTDSAHVRALARSVLAGEIVDDVTDPLSASRFGELLNCFRYFQGERAPGEAIASGIVARYVRQCLEDSVDSPGVRLALYFRRQAARITDAYAILADPDLVTVVRTALDIPAWTPEDLDRQARTLALRLDFSDFQSPAARSAFIERFAARWDAAHPPAAISRAVVVSAPAESTINADMLTVLQGLKLGYS